MGFDEIKDKVTGALSDQNEKIDESIDKIADFVDDKTGGKHSEKIDSSADKARHLLDKISGKDDDPHEDR